MAAREKSILEILNRLNLFYPDLNRIIAQYTAIETWGTAASSSWKLGGMPRQVISFQQQIYVCSFNPGSAVTVYNTDGKLLFKNEDFKNPYGIELDEEKSLIYVADDYRLTILNLKLEKISSWKLPLIGSYSTRGIKVDNDIIYLTLEESNQIFISDIFGKILQKWGSQSYTSAKPGEFQRPCGLTVVMNFVYICDGGNDRIQILRKETGLYETEWGKKI